MRVVVLGNQLAYHPLKLAMQDVLRSQAGVTLVEKGAVPTLVLTRERFERQVLVVSSAGKARGYLLRYEVSFQLHDAEGEEVMAQQTLRLHRDYFYDPKAAFAQDRVEQELREPMRRDAAQQILRRLAKANLEPQPEGQE
jgi:LPS-assembly lipoprotein